MTQDPHPYYDSEKRLTSQKQSLGIIIISIALVIFLLAAYKVTKWEEENKVEVWVEYEIGFKDLDKVILYKSHDLTDSLVFKVQNVEAFYGIHSIQKLEYRLP